MRHLLTLLAALLFCAPAQAQTLKALVYTTNGQVVYGGTNSLSFTNSVSFTSDVFGFSFEAASGSNYTQLTADGVEFSGAAQRANTRTNLGLGATWLTNTNVTNFRTAIGLDRIWAYKSTNQTNATTNLVSDSALTFTAAANTKYAVTLFLKMESGADSAKGKIIVSNAPTVIGHWTFYDPLNGQSPPTGILVTNEALFFLSDSQEPASFMQNFVVAAGTNNAPITFQFAIGSTNTNTVIVGAGSYIKAEVIE